MDRLVFVRVCAVAVCQLGLALPSAAQDPPDADEEILDGEDRSARDARGVMPVRPDGSPGSEADLKEWAIPSLAVPDFRPRASELLREGTVLHQMQGRLIGSTGGGRVYVFDEDENGSALAPMIVIPTVRLMEMERVLSTRDTTVTFLLTGEVFVYRGRNYIHPMRFTTLAIEKNKQDQQTDDAARVLGGDDVEDIISALQADAQRNEERESRGVIAPKYGLGRDGDMVVSKRGRVRRSTLGGWEFLIDNDVEDARDRFQDDADTPYMLLPCQLLESIEAVIDDSDRGAELVLSGTVYVYSGESYLLPSMFRVLRPSESGLTSGR